MSRPIRKTKKIKSKKTKKKIKEFVRCTLYHHIIEWRDRNLDEYKELAGPKIEKMDPKDDTISLLLDIYDYAEWFHKQRRSIIRYTAQATTKT